MEKSVIDLVKQYGEACANAVGAREFNGEPEALSFEEEAAELLDRIAALLPQQPVQARDETGLPLFIHTCGHVSPESTPGIAEGEHHRFPPCRTPGPWRPVLIGGTRAPEPIGGHFGPDWRWVEGQSAEQPDLMAQVMAELGVDRPEDVLPQIRGFQGAVRVREAQRDEARAEVERLKIMAGRRVYLDATPAAVSEIEP
jgi:hypothetical protein